MITELHKNDNDNEVVKYVELQSYSVSLRWNQSPDIDFVIMCNARYFVQGSGGFSSVIADTVRLRGGKVFN